MTTNISQANCLKVLLIDPYDDDGVSSDPAIPLGLGLIGSYIKEQVPNKDNVDVLQIFLKIILKKNV